MKDAKRMLKTGAALAMAAVMAAGIPIASAAPGPQAAPAAAETRVSGQIEEFTFPIGNYYRGFYLTLLHQPSMGRDVGFGNNMVSNYSHRLWVEEDGYRLLDGRGIYHLFTKNADTGAWEDGTGLILTATAEGYEVTNNEGYPSITYQFDKAGLAYYVREDSKRVEITQDKFGRVTRIQSFEGPYYNFIYGPVVSDDPAQPGFRCIGVEYHNGDSAFTLTYDEQNNLISVDQIWN